MTLKYVKPLGARGYITLGISGGGKISNYVVPESEYESLGSPLASSEISEENFSRILECDEYFRATKKALNILSFSDNSKKRLYGKLIEASFSRGAAERVVDDMVRLGYLNEERSIERFITLEVEKNCTGYRKIAEKLIAKGYSQGLISKVYSSLILRGEIDPEAARLEIIERARLEGASGEEIKKILYKRGYRV